MRLRSNDFKLYVGLHQPSDAKHVRTCFLSINRLRGKYGRKAPLPAGMVEAVIDSAAFTEIMTHGRYRHSTLEYARDAAPWCADPRVKALVAQDYMCEPAAPEKTRLTIAEHQRLTIERYDDLLASCAQLGVTTYILPVLQGWSPEDYVAHLKAYGSRLAPGAWVGVGSVCKRQASPDVIVEILTAIKTERPDLRLHGFGVKLTALSDPRIARLLATADSLAWSYSARKQGRSANDYREALAFEAKVYDRLEKAA